MALNSPFINPNLPLKSVFELNELNYRQVEKLVPKMAPAFQRSVISILSEQMGKPVLKKSANRVFEIYRQPNDYPAATIATRTASGTKLVLEWTDSTFQAIRMGNLIVANSGCLGYVETVAAGTATIAFFSNPNGNTAFVSADFAVGELAIDGGDVGNLNNRESKTTLFTLPIQYKNVIGQINESVTIDFESANQMTWIQGPDGQMYYAHAKVAQTMGRMKQYESYRLVGDFPAVFDSEKPLSGSILWQIKNQGGRSRSFSSAITESEFYAAADDFANAGGYTSNEIVIVCGRNYLSDIQKNVFKQFVTTAGNTNVVGGTSVKGIDAYEYGYNGVTYKFIVDRFLDNPQIFGQSSIFTGETKRSHSAIWMSTAPVATENGGTMPFIADYYYGVADIIATEVDGMIDSKGNPVKKGANAKLAATVELSLNKATQLSAPSSCYYHYTEA